MQQREAMVVVVVVVVVVEDEEEEEEEEGGVRMMAVCRGAQGVRGCCAVTVLAAVQAWHGGDGARC